MEKSYDQRVRERAMEFAKLTHPGTWEAAKESLIEHFTPAARLSVQREAEAFDMGYNISEEEPIFQPSTAESVKQSLGLVPQKDKP